MTRYTRLFDTSADDLKYAWKSILREAGTDAPKNPFGNANGLGGREYGEGLSGGGKGASSNLFGVAGEVIGAAGLAYDAYEDIKAPRHKGQSKVSSVASKAIPFVTSAIGGILTESTGGAAIGWAIGEGIQTGAEKAREKHHESKPAPPPPSKPPKPKPDIPAPNLDNPSPPPSGDIPKEPTPPPANPPANPYTVVNINIPDLTPSTNNAPNPWSYLQMPAASERPKHIRGGGVHHGPDAPIHPKKRRHHSKHPTDRKRK